jgi:hypothetical protein
VEAQTSPCGGPQVSSFLDRCSGLFSDDDEVDGANASGFRTTALSTTTGQLEDQRDRNHPGRSKERDAADALLRDHCHL